MDGSASELLGHLSYGRSVWIDSDSKYSGNSIPYTHTHARRAVPSAVATFRGNIAGDIAPIDAVLYCIPA